MPCSSRRIVWPITLLTLILLAITACSGENPAPVEVESSPTPELQVVVFATEAPTPTPTATTRAPTPTAAMGASTAEPTAAASSGDQSAPLNRPPDINPLTGLKVDDPALLKRRPIMVRVGNDPGIQQVGLEKADMVYEEIVEWWVTRFTAIYLSQDPEIIAPIRSARLINLQLVPQYGGALANSGGSDQVRWELSQAADLVNLDEFFSPQPYFYRENEGWQTRLAFNAATAREYMDGEDLEADVKLRGFVFSPKVEAKDLPKEAAGQAKEAIIPYPQQTSEVKWEYDAASGTYLRWKTGEPMEDFDGKQLTASNVIIYFAEHADTDIVEDSNGATSIRIVVNGLGTAWLLRDGQILKGNWETNGLETPNFIFNDGRPMPLKPGNTWVEVVPLDFEIEIDGVAHTRLSDASGKASSSDEPEAETTDEPETTVTPTSTPIGARPVATPTAEE